MLLEKSRAPFGILVFLILLAACGTQVSAPTPDRVATGVAEGKAIAATLTASVPTAPAAPPTATATAIPPTATATTVPPTATAVEIPPTPTSTLTPLAEEGLEINSIPAGSNVFVASLDELGITVQDDPKWDATTRALLGARRLKIEIDQFKLINAADEKYLRGTTPLKIPLKPGNYAVFLEVSPTAPFPDLDKLYDVLESDFAYGRTLTGLSHGHSGRVFLIEVLEDKFNRLTQLWQLKGASIAEIEKIYPAQNTFEVNEQKVKAELTGNIPDSDIPIIIRLLRKGGKAIYREGNTITIIEIEPTTGEISTLLKFED